MTFFRLAACAVIPLAIGALASVEVASAQDRSARYMHAGERADPPTGFSDMCARDSNLCADAQIADPGVDGQSVAPENLAHGAKIHSRATLRLIAAINASVNRGVRQVDDEQTHGVAEYWTRASAGAGDCEDIALEKQAQLIAAGVDRRLLRLAVAYDRRVGLHAVLIVTTARGDQVLDSQTSRIVNWNRTHYRWLRIQSASSDRVWSTIA